MLNNNLDVNSLEEINKNPVRITLNGKRHYTTPLPSGPAPSVTTIISETASEQNKTEQEIMKHYVRDIPLKRPNNPEDIASMVVFLSSEGARNISGQSYNVDGGLIPS